MTNPISPISLAPQAPSDRAQLRKAAQAFEAAGELVQAAPADPLELFDPLLKRTQQPHL
mgnify:CR=1 FL=1